MTHREVQLTDNRKHRQTSLSSEEHTLQLTQITRTYSPLRAFKRDTGTTARTGGLWPRYNSVLFFYISQYCNGPKKLHAVTAWFLLCFHLLKWCCWLVNAKVCSWDQSTKNMHQMKLLQLFSTHLVKVKSQKWTIIITSVTSVASEKKPLCLF